MAESSTLLTERLALRPPTPDDTPALFEFLGDPQAMQFTQVHRSQDDLRVSPAAWGRGYATELTQFCVAEARRLARWPKLTAFTHPENAASHQVLLRAGFVEERFVPEMNRRLYGIDLAAVNRAS